MKKTALFLTLLSIAVPVYAAGIGFGGFGFGDDEGSSVDLGAVVDVFKQSKQVLTDIDPKAERKLGQDAAALIVSATPVIENKRLNVYINKVGRWVAQQSERPDLEWRFAVLDTIAINAYATPGGYVFITAGLLLRLKSEAELATVLAHEIVHVVQGHHVRAMKKTAAVGLAGTIAGAATGNEALAEISTDGIKELYSRGLGRDDELESDSMGVVLAARAGYDPYAFMSVLLLLDSMNKEDGALLQFLATHPSPADRLQNLEFVMKGRFDQYDNLLQGDKRFVKSITEAFEG
ncbi:MAG: M48 family metalloprotease [Acidiferrobacterales bacterium]